MKRELVLPLANTIAELLRPACAEVVIAGSVRREKPEVKDIELVVCLHRDRELRFAESALDSVIAQAVMGRTLTFDTLVKRNGPRHKRFRQQIQHSGGTDDIAIDLFIAEPGNYGDTLAIRTGDADFSKYMMTARGQGGLLPDQFLHRDGYLFDTITRERVCCPTEEAFFSALRVPVPLPRDRNLSTIAKLRAGTYRPSEPAPSSLFAPALVCAGVDDENSHLPYWAR